MLLELEFGANCGPQWAGKAASMRGLLTGSFRALEHGWRLEFQFLPTEQRVGCGVCSFYFPVQWVGGRGYDKTHRLKGEKSLDLRMIFLIASNI